MLPLDEMQGQTPGNGISYHTLSFNSQALLVYLAALQQRPAIYFHPFPCKKLVEDPSPKYFPLPLSIPRSFIHAVFSVILPPSWLK
jgi:hypothetical protein